MAWGAALAVGVVMLALFPKIEDGMARRAAATARAREGEPAVASTPANGGAPIPEIPTDPKMLEQRRTDAMRGVSRVPGVDRALWSTQSTLLVYLSDDLAEPLSGICPVLLRYEELAPTRIQLQPPVGSRRPVRFLQCRSY